MLGSVCMGQADTARVSTTAQTRVVNVSTRKWQEMNRELSKKGIVKLDDGNVVIAITNGNANVEHCFVDSTMPVDFCGKNKKR